MNIKAILGACAATAVLAGAATANVEYDCGEVNNVLFSVTYFDEEDIAEVIGVALNGEQRSALMYPAVSGSGSRFVGPDVEFIEHQGGALLIVQGIQTSCSVFAISEPGFGTTIVGNGGGNTGAMAGRSFGGNLRAGPGMNFADVGSTFDGQPMTLIADTGVYMGNFSWWVVQLQNGQQAYQWGGILCAPGRFVQGVYNDGC